MVHLLNALFSSVGATPHDPCILSQWGVVPHISDCRRYFRCIDYRTVEGICPVGLTFNPVNKNCDYNQRDCATNFDTPGGSIFQVNGSTQDLAHPVLIVLYFVAFVILAVLYFYSF